MAEECGKHPSAMSKVEDAAAPAGYAAANAATKTADNVCIAITADAAAVSAATDAATSLVHGLRQQLTLELAKTEACT